MDQNDDDACLLMRAAQGETDAMRLIYERHHDALFAFLLSRGCDRETAKDVVHDAMLEVWRSAGRYRGSASVRTWIFTIARNKFVDRIRASARLSFVEDVPELPDESPNAEAVISATQDAARIRSCLGKLKDMQRTVIRLSFYEGLSYDEIAKIEDVPVGTIKSRVFHAKKSLMHCLSRSVSSKNITP